MARPLQSTHPAMGAPQLGLVAMTLLLCAFALFMCASHSRRRRRHWQECYGFFEEEAVIELHNDTVILESRADCEGNMFMDGRENDEEEAATAATSVWRKNILLGGKCQLPDFSGVIIYNADGNIVTPPKTPRPLLLTWK
ncbi:uncharacterized protein LOC104449574 [Eucalyptus grandis]|uniref:uncharacterized protein LOC104449574 n=1 Tax=Eucalyptus grandis TaxID=71139 RepID=UPI00192ED2B5|nr:uncharacterized protein LOC104449574 [Eucalyptus grandis]